MKEAEESVAAEEKDKSGLEGMMSTSEVSAKIADGEYADSRPSRVVVMSEKPQSSRNRMKIPYLQILQSQSDMVHKKQGAAGQIALQNYPPLDEAILVPLRSGEFREYRLGIGKDAILKCSSVDGVWGEGDPGGLCAECPLSQWGDRNPATGTSFPPPCTEGVAICFWSADYGIPVVFKFKGRGIQVADAIQTRATFSEYGTFGAKMTSALEKYAQGSAYSPRIEFILTLPEEYQRPVEKAMSRMRDSDVPKEGDVIDVNYRS